MTDTGGHGIDCGPLAGRVVGAEVAGLRTPGERPLRVFSVHVPTGRTSYAREAHRVLDLIAGVRGDADLVVGGDFNVTVGVRHAGEALPFHCDGIFVPGAWLPRLRPCEVLASEPWTSLSDHNPVTAVFASEPPRDPAAAAVPEEPAA